jgi:hypothetical protein
LTIFGNRDSAYDGSDLAGAAPSLEVPDPPSPPPVTSMREFGAPDTRRVILRVHGDGDIVVGSAEGRERAVQIARDMVRHVELASAKGEWPQIDERFIRPGAIVSIDVQRPE